MKILQVVHSFPPYHIAGTEVYVYNLSCELAKRHNVFIFHRTNDLYKKEYEVTKRLFNDLSIYSINNTFRHCDSFKMTYRNKFIDGEFSKILDKIKPDVVHIHHLLFLSITIIEEIKKTKIPILFTLHDYWLLCQQGQLLRRGVCICENHNDSECVNCLFYLLSLKRRIMRTYQILNDIIPNALLQIIKELYFNYAKATFLNPSEAMNQIKMRNKYIKEISKLVDLFIAPSKFLKKKFIEFGIPQEQIIFIQNGLERNIFTNFQRTKSKKLRFGYIGTLLPAKGPHILIDAFNRIQNHDIELKIYGKPMPYRGFEYYAKYLQRLVKNGNIQFMGGFNNKDISHVFSEIDILVVPSIWHENCPLTILEAFSSKTPVIASRIGGIPELINNDINGLLFNPRDTNSLQEKMQYLIDNKAVIEKFKENILDVKSIEDNAKEIEDIYSRLIAKRRI